jgi:hypothetical protein
VALAVTTQPTDQTAQPHRLLVLPMAAVAAAWVESKALSADQLAEVPWELAHPASAVKEAQAEQAQASLAITLAVAVVLVVLAVTDQEQRVQTVARQAQTVTQAQALVTRVAAVAEAQHRAVLAAQTLATDRQALSQQGQLLTVAVVAAVTNLQQTLAVLADQVK